MYFLTPDQNYRVDLIAGRIAEPTPDNCPGGFDSGDGCFLLQGLLVPIE